MAEAEKAEKTAASRVADIVVMLISLLILLGGFLAWRVYQANPARNDYDLAVGIFTETADELDDLRTQAEPLLEYCENHSDNKTTCDELRKAYDASVFEKPKKLSRITSASTYKKETASVNERAEQARAARDNLSECVENMSLAIEATLEQKVGPQRAQLRETVEIVSIELADTQASIDASKGKADESLREQAQKAIDDFQALIDQANALTSENPEDYTNLNTQLRQKIDGVTNWKFIAGSY